MTDVSGQSSQELLEDLFENAPCGYLVLDASGRITKVNRRLADWLKHAPPDLIGQRVTALVSVAGRIFYETHFAPLLRLQGFCNEVAFDFKRADGERIAVLVNGVEKRDDQGQVVSTRIAVFQAAHRRTYERELIKAKAAIEETRDSLAIANATLAERIGKVTVEKEGVEQGLLDEREFGELREQFVAVLGHDLRNPLASIIAATRLLSREVTSERGTQVLQLMDGSAKRMSALIDNVLDFARARLGGGIGLQRDADEPLENTIQLVVDELRANSPDRLIVCEMKIEQPVSCDRGRIGQMVSNLLGNAISHGDPDSPVIVHAATIGDREFELWVSNSGDPIPEGTMGRLFQPFVRGEARGYQQGLGLGLHIASEIAKAHGGTLTVTSSAAETRFTFRMRLEE